MLKNNRTDYSITKSTKNSFLQIIENFLDSIESIEIRSAAEFCAIFHWFNIEIISWVLEDDNSVRTANIETALKSFSFVTTYNDLGFCYHEEIRRYVIELLKEKKSDYFIDLNKKAVAYFNNKLKKEKNADKRILFHIEKMYHLLIFDEAEGVKIFQDLFSEAEKKNNIGTCNLLLSRIKELNQFVKLNMKTYINYYQGRYFNLAGDRQKAIRKFRELVKKKRISPNLKLNIYFQLGEIYQKIGEWGEAVEYYRKSLDIYKSMNKNANVTLINAGRILCNLGLIFYRQGRWKDAIKRYDEAFEISKKTNDKFTMAQTLDNLAKVYYRSGKWDDAIKYANESIDLFKEQNNKYGEAWTLITLTRIYRRKRELEKAESSSNKSYNIFKSLKHGYGEGRALHIMGEVYYYQNRFEKAERCYKKSIEIKTSLFDKDGLAQTYDSLGLLYAHLKKWELAINNYLKSYQISVELGDNYFRAKVLNNIGNYHIKRNKIKKAIPKYLSSLKIRKKLGDLYGVGESEYSLGNCYLINNEFEKSVEHLMKSREIFHKIGDIYLLAESTAKLGDAYKLHFDYMKASELYEKAIEWYKKCLKKYSNKNFIQEKIDIVSQSQKNIKKLLK